MLVSRKRRLLLSATFASPPFAFVKFYQVNLLSFPISSFLLRFSSSKTFKFPKLFQFLAAAIQDFYLNFWRKKVFDGFWTDQMNIVQTFDIVRLYRKSSSRSFFLPFPVWGRARQPGSCHPSHCNLWRNFNLGSTKRRSLELASFYKMQGHWSIDIGTQVIEKSL